MNYSQPGVVSGITNALSTIWEGTKKAVSSVLPGQESVPAYNGQTAGRRRRHRKSRKTRRGGQPIEDVAPPMPERPPAFRRQQDEPPAHAGVGIASNVPGAPNVSEGGRRRYRKTRKSGRKH